jgi:hypothetical protein
MKLNKVAFAVASALAIAGSAHAGQIQASATQIAKEVVASDTQALIAPAVTYAFAGDVNAQANSQGFQLQYILKSGTWAVGTGNLITATEVLIPVTLGAAVAPAINALDLLQVNYVDGDNKPKTSFPALTLVDAFVSADKTKLVFNVAIPQGAGPEFFMKNPRFTVNPPGTNVKINGLATLLSDLDCLPDSKDVKIEFKHALSNPGNATILNANPNEGAEHLRGGAENEAVMLTFVENVKINFTPAAASSRTTAASLNKKLADVDSATPEIEGNFDSAALTAAGMVTPPAPSVTPDVSRHYLGKAKISMIGAGKDLNYSNTYGGAFRDTLPASVAGAMDLDTAAGKGANLTLTVPNTWPVGTIVQAFDKAGVLIAGMTATTVAGTTSVSLSAITAAAADKLISDGVYVFADFPGNAGIPNTGNVGVKATLFKLAAANERNNMCVGNFAGIGGGIKIDVRNYASYASFGTTGPSTVVRMINNSENNAADVYGQMIYADGTYGAWGKLTDLKPREVANMSNKDIEEKLVNAPAATNPFGAGTTYTSTAGTAVVAGAKAGIGDRLRLISTTGTTLRVQSYMVVGSTVIDTSNAQGVDFENGANDRAPTLDAQPISQDAINGLSK